MHTNNKETYSNMEIITENGKDYLLTYVAKIDNSSIDANALFADIQQTVNKIIKNTNTKHKTNNIAIYKGYGSNLQSRSEEHTSELQ